MTVETRWQPGDHVVMRLVGSGNALVWGFPKIVVEDGPDMTALFVPEGPVIERYDHEEGRWLEPLHQRMHELRLIFPGRAHSLVLYFDAGTGVPPWYEPYLGDIGGRFKGYKVDLSSPYKRTPLGFDTTDNALDVMIRPDLSWYWKDEVALQRFISLGVFTADEAGSFYAEGSRVIQAVERRESPFVDGWDRWRPEAQWAIPRLPAGWEQLPGFEVDLNRGEPYRSLRRRNGGPEGRR